MRKWRTEIFLALVACMAIWFTAGLIAGSVRQHVIELEILMLEREYQDEGAPHLHMVAKFVRQYKAYKKELSRAEVDLGDQKILAAFADSLNTSGKIHGDPSFFGMLSKASINGIRHLMNSRLLPDTTVFEVNRHLELAYYLERNREYRQALREYSVFSETGPVLGIIWLHQGYCHAILGEVSQARNLFLQVIQEHGDSQLGVTASILLAYLERFVHEGGRVASGGMKRQERAVNLAELFQCKEALMVIDSLDAKESLKASTAYYKGLCLEELGDKLGATKSYAKSIKGSEDLTLSRDANRRLLIIGSQISPSNSIRNSAIRMNQTFQDPIFKEIQKADLPSRVLPVSDSIPAQVAPEMDSLEEFVKENASTQATSKTRPERVKLMTKSGKVLYGELLSGKQDRIQRIRTIMGVVGIPQKEIANIIAQ